MQSTANINRQQQQQKKLEDKKCWIRFMCSKYCMGGTVVRVLASHDQCGAGSIPASWCHTQSRSQRPRSFWLVDGDRDLRPGPTPEVRDSWTSGYSVHVQSQV